MGVLKALFWLLEPLLSFEKNEHSQRGENKNAPNGMVAILPLQLWNDLEIHAVYARNERDGN